MTEKINLPRYFTFLALSALTLGSGHAVESNASKVGAGQEDQYELLMNSKTKVCKHVQEVLNRDIERYGPDYDQRKFADPMFTAIHWQPTSDPMFRYGGDYARFDVNNDSRQDLVVRLRLSIKSRDFHLMFVFDNETALESLKTIKDLREKRIGEIHFEAYDLTHLSPRPREDWMEEGRQYYPALYRSVFFYPFVFNGMTYLLIKDSPDVRSDPELALVALYKGGLVQSADPQKMRDLCYLKKKVRNPTIKRYSP